MHSRQSVSDRFYRALYAKLNELHTQPTATKHATFLNVLYKALAVDTSETRLKAFVKRMLQSCAGQAPAFVCGMLYLVSEVCKMAVLVGCYV